MGEGDDFALWWPTVLLYLALQKVDLVLSASADSHIPWNSLFDDLPEDGDHQAHIDAFHPTTWTVSLTPPSLMAATSCALRAFRRVAEASNREMARGSGVLSGGEDIEANTLTPDRDSGDLPSAVARKRFAELARQSKELFAESGPDLSTDPPQFIDLHRDDVLGWSIKARDLLRRVCGSESEYYKEFLAIERGSYYKYWDKLDSLTVVFFAAREDYEGGYLQSARTLMQEQEQESPAGGGATHEDPRTAYDDEARGAAKEDFHPSVDFLEPLARRIEAASCLDSDSGIPLQHRLREC